MRDYMAEVRRENEADRRIASEFFGDARAVALALMAARERIDSLESAAPSVATTQPVAWERIASLIDSACLSYATADNADERMAPRHGLGGALTVRSGARAAADQEHATVE